MHRLEPEILRRDPGYITVLKPYDEFQLRKLVNVDSLLSFNNNRHTTWLGRKIWDESFLKIDSADWSLRLDPVFDFSLGNEMNNSRKLMGNTRGFLVRMRLGNTVGITSSFYENQTVFPLVWDEFISKYVVAPGQSRTKRYHSNGWDYAYATGVFTWKPKGVFSLQFGQDKNFIGDGYRSLLLSDVSTVYPFLKFSLTWKNFQYTRMIALLQNIDYKSNNADTREFPQKIANFHVLTFNMVKHLQLSLFEGIIMNDPNTKGNFTMNYEVLDPLPFLDVVTRTSRTEALMNSIGGINLCWRVSPDVQLYGQWSLDDPIHREPNGKEGVNEYGYQLGLKYFNAFSVKNLYMQAEYNHVRPYTYAKGDSVIAYTHLDQPLAHPLGSNFEEGVGIAGYRYKRWYAEYKITYARYGADNGSLLTGKDILRPQTSNTGSFLQGIKTNLVTQQARLSWYINPATNSCFSAGIYWQDQRSSVTNRSTHVVFFSFSTNLRNLYYDF